MNIAIKLALAGSLSLLAACSMGTDQATVPEVVPMVDASDEAKVETAGLPVDQTGKVISPEFPFEKKFVEVNGSNMAYVDEGEGPVVLFLHGNPTSMYLWRNIIPYVTDNHRAIAVDLIGMGDSDKPDIGYTFGENAEYIDGFIEALELKDITLVIHDWGSVIGMRYARLNPDNVRAVAFMEAIVTPGFPVTDYVDMGPEVGEFMRNVRTDGLGEEMILEGNFFVEGMLPAQVVRGLTEEEMAVYRKPFPTPESRLPTLQWPRELPIAGGPSETVEAVIANGTWLESSTIPKLFLYSVPGTIATAEYIEHMRSNLSNLTVVEAGPGLHFLQEDQPHMIGAAISDWLEGVE